MYSIDGSSISNKFSIHSVYTALSQMFEIQSFAKENYVENDIYRLKFHRDNIQICPFIDLIGYYLSKYTNVVWDVGVTVETENKKTYNILRPRSNSIPNVKVFISRAQDTGLKRVHHTILITVE